MSTIHWLGAGLSSVPGIRRLAAEGNDLILWNRTVEKAEAALAGLDSKAEARPLDWNALAASIQPGNVVVSMLPATWHGRVANICLERGAHFVSSSYVSPEMKELSDRAASRKLCLVNEVGLDPGLDHLLAHLLMHEYQTSGDFDHKHAHRFRSYCGGFPKIPNDFRYKFSWSPLGVLRALKSPARWISEGETRETQMPWKSLSDYAARLSHGEEVFQAYPNRDSIPFMREYGFEDDWNVRQFVRGTLRLDGWSEAWAEIFALVENADGEDGIRALEEKSGQLWEEYRYHDGEPDRVVLAVDLEVNRDGETVWHQAYCLDECGHDGGSAMGRLVSLTTSVAVDDVLSGQTEPGVSSAPRDLETVNRWIQTMSDLGETIEKISLE